MDSQTIDPSTSPADASAARRWSIRLPTGFAARWTLAAGALLIVALWFGFRQAPRPDPMQPVRLFSWNWWRYPIQRNAFVEPVIRSDLTTVFPMPDGRTIWAGGSGGLLIVSRDAGRSWDTAAVYGPANWDQIVAPRFNTEDTTVVITVPLDTTQGQAVVPTTDSILPADSSTVGPTSFRTDVPAGRGPTSPPSGPVNVLLRAVGTLAGPAPLFAQGTTTRGNVVERASAGSRPVRLVGDIRDIFFLNARLGWAATTWGDVLITRDGGERWDVNPGAAGRLDVLGGMGGVGAQGVGTLGFADSLRGMVSGYDGIKFTTDGGRTWSRSSTLDTRYFLGRLVSGSVGFGSDNDGRFVRTDDAGATWRAIPSPSVGREFWAGPYFRDAQTGWVAYRRGEGTTLYRTRDGGASWDSVYRSTSSLFLLPPYSGGPLLAISNQGGVHWLRSADGATWDTLRLPVASSSILSFSAGADGRVWAAGGEGILLVSGDSMRRWSVVMGGGTLKAATFASPTRGWAVGRAGSVLATRDGGESWHPQRSGTSADLLSVAFSTPRDGWAVGTGGTLIRTRDGGRSWRQVRFSGVSGNEMLSGVQFADSLNGWISGRRTLLRTTNGGRTWQDLAGGRLFLVRLHFVDARTGWMSTFDGVRRTRDGGVTWDTTTVPTRYGLGYGALWFASDSVGWVSRGNVIHATRDGGRTWQKQRIEGVWEIHGLRFADERTGYAVSDGGAVYRTTDGGARWQRDTVPTRRDLFGLAFADGEPVAVGAGGAVLRRTAAGEWQAIRTTTTPAPWLYLACTLLAVSVVVAVRRSANEGRAVAARSAASVEAMLISDRPLQPGDPDPFELNTLALGISKFLRNPRTRPPLTMAITGRWGTGKSSLMNLVRRDLEASRFRPVWFNAWHHQKEEHLLAALLENIRAQAVPGWLTPAGLVFRMRLFWVRVKRHRPSALLVCAVVALFLGYLAGDVNRVSSLWTSLSRTALDPIGTGRAFLDRLAADFRPDEGSGAVAYLTLAAAGFAAAAWRAFRAFGMKPAALMASIAGRVRLRDLQQQTGFRHQFAQEFSEVTEALHPMDMVLFVDDLDRCRPDQVLEVLESINFLVSSGDCVVVMGMDREWVVRCVGLAFDQIAQESALAAAGAAPAEADRAGAEVQKRSNREEFARHYLEKLVNIEIPVPVPTRRQLQGLVQLSGIERRQPPSARAPRTLRTTGLRFLRDPRTATYALYAAVAAVVFTGSFVGFRPQAAGGPTPFETNPAVTALTPAPAGDSAPGPAETADDAAPEPQPETRERPGELVGAPPMERAFGGPAVAGLGLLLMMGIGLLRRREGLVQDSRSFTSALGAWSGVIASRAYTPRITKKFLNRLRYYAMRQRALEPAQTLGQRLSAVIRRLGSAVRPAGPEPAPEPAPVLDELRERRADAQGPIPEPVLVALACLHECHPDGVPQAAYEDFYTFVRTSPLTAEFSADILQPAFEYPRSLTRYRERFSRISAGVRTH